MAVVKVLACEKVTVKVMISNATLVFELSSISGPRFGVNSDG